MQTNYKEIYCSSNGDRWLLAWEPGSGKVFVKHEANAASGGFGTHMELGAFLTREKHSPQVNHLLALIGSLVPESAG
jgi:hypothetical protein